MQMQWRTLSNPASLLHARQPHPLRPANSRQTVRAHAAFINPHALLGVGATADVKEVKRAYRKLALQYHPDVCKSEDGHERFMALTQAYEMLLGKAEGKTDPNHASSSGWDFHDWYWNFRMQRSWEKQQRQAAAAAGAGDPSGAEADPSSDGRRAAPHAHAACQQPEGREKLRSQLAGLRHRAAVRANRPGTSASPSAAAPAASSPAEAYSLDTEEADAASAEGSNSPPHSSPFPDITWSWCWDETVESDDEPAVTTASAASTADDTSDLHGQYTHMYGLHDGHYGTVVANHAVPFPGGHGAAAAAAAAASSQQHQQEAEQPPQPAGVLGEAVESEPEVEPEPFSNPFDQQPHAQNAARRRFTGDNVTRESVSHQLAGLRRKAAMKSSSQ